VRAFVPLLDGTDRVGVLAFTSDPWDEHDTHSSVSRVGSAALLGIEEGRCVPTYVHPALTEVLEQTLLKL